MSEFTWLTTFLSWVNMRYLLTRTNCQQHETLHSHWLVCYPSSTMSLKYPKADMPHCTQYAYQHSQEPLGRTSRSVVKRADNEEKKFWCHSRNANIILQMAEADWAYSHYWRCRKEEFGASIQQLVQQGSWKPPHSMKCKFFEPGISLGPHFLNSQHESDFSACTLIRTRTACRAEFREPDPNWCFQRVIMKSQRHLHPLFVLVACLFSPHRHPT